MGRKKDDRRRARVKKETLRKLDERAMSPDDLAQAGGGFLRVVIPLKSNPCPTFN